ncbi:NAD(P)/FAD-dependent oxidoreductase [Candidatus Marsarchaeota archaeon]|jgi:Dehydrogenases (flavoproteins)|nr:NAD(P)/FAD-dependent oxidoreductase [Candidatus Marsarchaeota archaeon]MCL5092612.1 NAD(P)/FAD-dependent oxidoreductase [Candidatus Marsarchaeota archaeon]
MARNVAIIGAGVIGLTLAIALAKKGIYVTVYDGKKRVSDGAERASGILSKNGLERLQINYKSSIVNSLYGARLHANKAELNVKSKSVQAYVLDRGMFVEALYKDALSFGVDVVLGQRLYEKDIKGIASDPDSIVVGADGAVSSVAKAFGFPKINEYVLTYKAEYSKAKIEDKHVVDLFFSNSISNRFFGWMAPYSDSKLEIGVGTSDSSKSNSRSAFEKLVKNNLIKQTIDGAVQDGMHASLIPLAARKKTVSGNVLLVGDAAGQIKATTGGGIIFGASCAKTASEIIIRNINSNVPLSAYESEWRKRYGLDLRLHSILHRYYSGSGALGLELLMKTAKLLGAENFFSKYGDMDSPKIMIKRFFLRGLSD